MVPALVPVSYTHLDVYKRQEGHKTGSYVYIEKVRDALAAQLPQLNTYFQVGGLVDSVVNQGLPAPIDIQISSNDQEAAYAQAQSLATKLRGSSSVSAVFIPQDLKYPGLEMDIDRERASLIGLTPRNVVDNVITALTSNGVIAPSYWIDPKTGNNYMLTVQYSNRQIGHMNMEEFGNIPLRGRDSQSYTPLRSVVFTKQIDTPTEVDHYQLRRVIDIYVLPRAEALNSVSKQCEPSNKECTNGKWYGRADAWSGAEHGCIFSAIWPWKMCIRDRGTQAAVEFQKIIDHSGIVWNC